MKDRWVIFWCSESFVRTASKPGLSPGEGFGKGGFYRAHQGCFSRGSVFYQSEAGTRLGGFGWRARLWRARPCVRDAAGAPKGRSRLAERGETELCEPRRSPTRAQRGARPKSESGKMTWYKEVKPSIRSYALTYLAFASLCAFARILF